MNTSNFIGYVYLVQSEECISSGRFKIGMSEASEMSRIEAYGGDRKEHIIRYCDNPFDVEAILIKKFTETFKVAKGKEYFFGDLDKAVDIFNHEYITHAICDTECFIGDHLNVAISLYKQKLRDVWKNDVYYDFTRSEKIKLCRDVLMPYLQLDPRIVRLFYHFDQEDLNERTINAGIEFVELEIMSEHKDGNRTSTRGFVKKYALERSFQCKNIEYDSTKVRNYIAKHHRDRLTEWCREYIENESIEPIPRRFSEADVSRPSNRINNREMFLISPKSLYKILSGSRSKRLIKNIARFIWKDIHTIYERERVEMLIDALKCRELSMENLKI